MPNVELAAFPMTPMYKWFILLSALILSMEAVAQFAPIRTIAAFADGFATSVQPADVDADGDLDVVFGVSNGDMDIAWIENLGDGKFSTRKFIYDGTGQNRSIHAADFDGDGDPDILASYIFANEKMTYHENLGSGNFSDERIITLSTGVDGIYPFFIGDLDGDDDMDILASNTAVRDVYLFWNDGNGEFAIDSLNTTLHGARNYKLIDMDDDDDLDIVGTIGSEHWIRLWLNDGAGHFGTPMNIITEFGSTKMVALDVADVDGDQDYDLITGWNTGHNSWHENLGNFEFSSQKSFGYQLEYPRQVIAADYDLDGDQDVLSTGLDTDFNLGWYENYGAGVFSPTLNLSSWGTGDTKTADMDGDGDLDIVISSGAHIDFIENYYNNAILEANIFLDENGNGVKDDQEPLIDRSLISLSPAPITTQIDAEPGFRYWVQREDYTLTIDPEPCFVVTTGSNTITVSVDSGGVFQAAFGVQLISSIADMKSVLTSGTTRCGFEVPFWLNARNTGCNIAKGRVALIMHEHVSLQSADPFPEMISGDTLWWSYDHLFLEDVYRIKMNFEMASSDFVGDTIDMPVLTYARDTNDALLLVDEHIYTSILNCAIDPNDKQVSPSRGGRNNTLMHETLDYVVRFQNTGTDTAFRVEIRDQIDRSLDLDSIEIIAASHPYKAFVGNYKSDLRIVFDPILLPDSTVDRSGSEGFVRYSIPSKSNLNERTVIKNHADIFFDFNAPIRTNAVHNRMVSTFTCIDSSGPAGQDIEPLHILTELYHLHCISHEGGKLVLRPMGGMMPYYAGEYVFTDSLVIDSLPEGPGSIYITDAGNCSLTLQYEIFPPDTIDILFFVQDATGPQTTDGMIVWHQADGGLPPFTYLWSNGSTDASQLNLLPGTYAVTVTDAAGCSRAYEFIIGFTVATSEAENAHVPRLSPNPLHTETILSYEADANQQVHVRIFGLDGRLMFQRKLNATTGENAWNIDRAMIPISGLFIVELDEGDRQWYGKLLVE